MTRIILIGGTPRCGKTTLAQKLSKELGIPWISTDALESIAHGYVPEDKVNTLFPKAVLRKETNLSNDEMYDTYSVEEIVDSYIKQADTTSRAIEILVEYAIKDDWDYIIEGYHVTPKLIAILSKDNPEVSSIILVNSNSNESIERSINSDAKSDWLRDNTKNEATYTKIGEMIDLYSKKLSEDGKSLNIEVVDMGEDFQENFDNTFDSLMK
jgi:2-phosphoglycerate kinase